MPTLLSNILKKLKLPIKKTQKVYLSITAFIAIIVFLLLLIITLQAVYAEDKCKDLEDCERRQQELQNKINTTASKLNNLTNSINSLSSQLDVTQSQLDKVQSDINDIKSELDQINITLNDRNQKLSEKIAFRNNLLRNYSKKNIINDLELFFTTNEHSNLTGFQLSTFIYAFNKATSGDTLKIIGALNSEIREYEKNKQESEAIKKDLETAQNNLISLKKDLDARKATAQSQANQLEQQKSGYEADLEALQSKILSLKYGDENGSVGDYVSPTAKTPDPPDDFESAFAVFSYGAYTHYNGMSQYGAKGRADSGDKYDEILKFYYKVGLDKKGGSWDKENKIKVQGYGEMTYQKYLYGIAEMPSDWNIEALKAQAVAARTYAYKANKPICTTQACQVFSKSKSDNPPSKWAEAVNKTSGQMLKNSSTSQYSSTTGGYLNQAGWDPDGKWPNDAWEKKAKSPWFYKAWYTKSYNNGDVCGHPHPWLTEEEMADILNSYIVWSKGSSKDKSHITPRTTSCWGGDPYSLKKMKEVAVNYGKSFSKVSSVDVTISNGGYTSQVSFQTDNGSISITGSDFKTVYNLRAPGYLSVKSRLFDIELRK